MANREAMRTNAAGVLKPGETVQAVIPAQTIFPLLYLPMLVMAVVPAVLITLIAEPFRVIVVTDRRILVCKSGKFRAFEVNEVLETLPRKTEIGPPRRSMYKCRALGATPLYISRRFFTDVREMDALRPGA